jgi:hypothetical protein
MLITDIKMGFVCIVVCSLILGLLKIFEIFLDGIEAGKWKI